MTDMEAKRHILHKTWPFEPLCGGPKANNDWRWDAHRPTNTCSECERVRGGIYVREKIK